MIIRRMIAPIQNKELNATFVPRALHLPKAAWKKFTKLTIANYFCYAGFKTKEEYEKETEKNPPSILKPNPHRQQDRQVLRLR